MVKETSLQCTVVTPERAVLNETVDFVAVPMYDGELGVLPGHTPLIGRLGSGELRIRKAGNIRRLFIDGGFVQIRDNVVSVLTQKAIEEEELTVEDATTELELALRRGDTPDAHEDQLKNQLRARAKLRMARRKQAREA